MREGKRGGDGEQKELIMRPTKCLVLDAISTNRNSVPNNRAADVALQVVDRKRNTSVCCSVRIVSLALLAEVGAACC